MDSQPQCEARLIDIAPFSQLAVLREGTTRGPAIILIHGLGTESSLWRPQREHFRATHDVVTFDFPGHGQSPDWPEVTLQKLAAAVWRIADESRIDRVTLVGTSMGAVVALCAASQHPERVERLVLCGASLASSDRLSGDLQQRAAKVMRDGLAEVADMMVAKWFPAASQVPENTRREMHDIFMRTSPKGYAACASACVRYDLRDTLALLQDRTCLVGGALDGAVPAHLIELATANPGARLMLLDGVGHYPSLERSAQVNALIAGEC